MSGVILFDGFCGLCNRWVDFVLVRDRRRRFRFASLQSEAGKALLRLTSDLPSNTDTVVLFEDGVLYTRSTAALRVFGALDFPWKLLRILLLVPRPLRDCVYDFIARHRYQWFGRREVCRLPGPQEAERFLLG